jgi:hypothetical protein
LVNKIVHCICCSSVSSLLLMEGHPSSTIVVELSVAHYASVFSVTGFLHIH